MYKATRPQYSIKSCPSGDTVELENLLNSMSESGWELYSMQEVEVDDSYQYNCIFVKDFSQDEVNVENVDIIGFKSKMERIMNPTLEPYDICIDLQKKLQEKRKKINNIKSLLDSTPEDARASLNNEISKNIEELTELKKKLIEVLSPDVMNSKIGEEKLSISISDELIDIVNSDSSVNLISKIVSIRQQLTEKLGYIIPKVKIDSDETLQTNEFIIKVRGIPALKGFAYPGYTMYFRDELKISKFSKDAIKDDDFITGKKIVWIENSKTKNYWAKGLDASDYIGRLLEYITIKHIDDLFDYSDMNRYIEIVGNQNLYLIENVIPDFISIAELKYILTSLIKEKVSIRDIMFIFEKINDFADESTKEDLLARLRVALGRQISASLANKDGYIHAFALNENNIKYILKQTEADGVLKIDASKLQNISSNIQNAVKKYQIDTNDLILIAPYEIRYIISLVLMQFIPNIRVIAREELLYDYPLEIIETV